MNSIDVITRIKIKLILKSFSKKVLFFFIEIHKGRIKIAVIIKGSKKLLIECLPIADIKKHASIKSITTKNFKFIFSKNKKRSDKSAKGIKSALNKKLFIYMPIPEIGMNKNNPAIESSFKLKLLNLIQSF